MASSVKTKKGFSLLAAKEARIRFAVGLALALVCVGVCGIWFDIWFGVVMAVLFVLISLVKIRAEKPLAAFVIIAAWAVLCVFLSVYSPVFMVQPEEWFVFFKIGKMKILLNMMVAAVIYGICLAAFGKIKPAVIAASTILVLFSTGNAFVYQFRLVELKPTDFLSVATAMNVASQYMFEVNFAMAYCWMMYAWTLFAALALPEEKPVMPRLLYRLGAVAAAVVCALIVWSRTDTFYLENWYNWGSINNGYYLNFSINLSRCFVGEPETYDDDALLELEQSHSDAEGAAPEKLPTILVIMNESFTDLSVLGDNFAANMEVTPNLSAVGENAVKGYALCSVFGGNTPNSEFEFLTGNSMAWLPNGSVVYQQHINGEHYSLPRLLEEYGYETMATHPYLSNGWQRTKIYPLFGFDSFTFIEDYPQQKMLRTYVSDREMYEYVLDTLDEKSGSPLFLFGISMQNHGGYGTFPEDAQPPIDRVELEGYAGDYPLAEVYMSVLREADKALGFLLEELEKREDEVVLLFFGDHFPRLENEFYSETLGGEYDTLSEQVLQYKVPFFIWSNKGSVPEQSVECTSLSYLSRYLLEAAGFEPNAYYDFLTELEENIPAINAMGYYSKARQDFIPFNEAQGKEARWLELYRISQYNNLFDTKNLIPGFFGEYMD